jgi:hypothetical protein
MSFTQLFFESRRIARQAKSELVYIEVYRSRVASLKVVSLGLPLDGRYPEDIQPIRDDTTGSL